MSVKRNAKSDPRVAYYYDGERQGVTLRTKRVSGHNMLVIICCYAREHCPSPSLTPSPSSSHVLAFPTVCLGYHAIPYSLYNGT